MPYEELKLEVAEARALMEQGRRVEALEVLEQFFDRAHYMLRNFGPDPDLQKAMDAARRLSGEIRGRMTEVVLKGPKLKGPADRDIWQVDIWPGGDRHISELVYLTEEGSWELGEKLHEMYKQKLVRDFNVTRLEMHVQYRSLEDFERKVLSKIAAGTFA